MISILRVENTRDLSSCCYNTNNNDCLGKTSFCNYLLICLLYLVFVRGYSRYVDFNKIVSLVKGFLINICLYTVTSLHSALTGLTRFSQRRKRK